MAAKRRHADIPTLPMFPMTAVTKSAGEKPKRVRSVAFGQCPECRAHERVGLVRTASHLVWRQHFYRTHSGAQMPCRASGVAVCQAPPRGHDVTCDCA